MEYIDFQLIEMVYPTGNSIFLFKYSQKTQGDNLCRPKFTNPKRNYYHIFCIIFHLDSRKMD